MSTVINRVINPSVETNTSGYTNVPGTTGAVTAGVVSTTSPTTYGTKVARCTWTTATTAAGGGVYFEVDLATAGLAVGDVVSAGIFHVLTSLATRVQLSVEFRTGAATISTSTATAKQTAATTVYTAKTDASFKLENLTVPATCTKIRIRLLSVAGTGFQNWAIAAYLQVDALMLNKGATLNDYVDGSLGGMYVWAGTAGASLSTLYVPYLTLTVVNDGETLPYIIVKIDDMPPTVTTLTMYRASDRRTFKGRGAIAVPVSSGFSFPDAEAPFGVESTYRAQLFNSVGTDLGFTETATATIDCDVTWIHNPLFPDGGAQIDLDQSSGRKLVRPSDGSVEQSDNRTLGVLISGMRRGLKGVDLFFSTQSLETANKFQDMLGGYAEEDQTVPVLCVRSPPYDRLPRTFFVAALELAELPITVHMGGQLIEFEATGVDEVNPPFPGLIVPLLSRDDIDAFYSSRDAIDAAYLRRLDIDRDYSKVGTA